VFTTGLTPHFGRIFHFKTVTLANTKTFDYFLLTEEDIKPFENHYEPRKRVLFSRIGENLRSCMSKKGIKGVNLHEPYEIVSLLSTPFTKPFLFLSTLKAKRLTYEPASGPREIELIDRLIEKSFPTPRDVPVGISLVYGDHLWRYILRWISPHHIGRHDPTKLITLKPLWENKPA
jgi:hypothetical protein